MLRCDPTSVPRSRRLTRRETRDATPRTPPHLSSGLCDTPLSPPNDGSTVARVYGVRGATRCGNWERVVATATTRTAATTTTTTMTASWPRHRAKKKLDQYVRRMGKDGSIEKNGSWKKSHSTPKSPRPRLRRLETHLRSHLVNKSVVEYTSYMIYIFYCE